jgi:hypothetical protein
MRTGLMVELARRAFKCGEGVQWRVGQAPQARLLGAHPNLKVPFRREPQSDRLQTWDNTKTHAKTLHLK